MASNLGYPSGMCNRQQVQVEGQEVAMVCREVGQVDGPASAFNQLRRSRVLKQDC